MTREPPQWIYPPPASPLERTFATTFHIPHPLAQALFSRGYQEKDTVHEFFYGELSSLYDPYLFPDMKKATSRILRAIGEKESILLYGDNDVDGMTGTALLYEYLQALGATVHFHSAPHDLAKGAILQDALPICQNLGVSLLLTIDCGSSAAKEIDHLQSHHIDVLITDHHEPTSIAHPYAFLNPKLPHTTYPNRHLTGVGVAFKLVQALEKALGTSPLPLAHLLDLVALGTVADLAPLQGENRILVRYGMKTLLEKRRPGIALLATPYSTNDISIKIAPRLNSLGRIADPNQGVHFLLTKDPSHAEKLLHILNLHNETRQKIEKQATEEILALLQKKPSLLQEKALLFACKDWHPGIVAIIASKLSKQYNRPIAICAIEKGIVKGSLRTIPSFPLLEFLKQHAALLLDFGGHDFAAGITLSEENLPLFRKALFLATKNSLTTQDITPKIFLDAHLSLEEVTFEFLEALHLFEPCGIDNPSLLFYTDVYQKWPPKVLGQHHLKLFLEQNGRSVEAISFYAADRSASLKKHQGKLRIAFTAQENTFQDKSSIQIVVKDWLLL